MAVPVAVPDSTSREPSVVVKTLAVTPGLFTAPLIAAAMPDKVLSVESMFMVAEFPPTAMTNAPVPTAVFAPANALDERLAAVARFCTVREYWAGMASDVAEAVAMVSSPRLTMRPAKAFGLSRVVNVACNVSSALLKVP